MDLQKALDIFSSRSKHKMNNMKILEILRFVDMGYKVKMKETFVDSIAVDIPEDVIKVEKFLENFREMMKKMNCLNFIRIVKID